VTLDKYGVENPVDARQYKKDPRSLDFDQLHAIVKPPQELLEQKLRDECVRSSRRRLTPSELHSVGPRTHTHFLL
jgi:hypothetical protein